MKKRIMRFVRIAAAIAAALIITMVSTACSPGEGLDVVGQHSIVAFGNVLNAMPEYVAAEEEPGDWALTAIDGGARFIWGGGDGQSLRRDILLEVDATPFLHAGLVPSMLPESYAFQEVEGKPLFMVGAMLGGDAFEEGGNTATPSAAYERLVKAHRQVVGYHMAMDHFNVALGDGNMIEWAKDMAVNGATGETQDKDIVFVLNPAPLIAAGVDHEAVEGWAYAQVPMDMGGDPTHAWKFLKPFDLQ